MILGPKKYSTKYHIKIKTLSVLLTISFVGMMPPEILAQGTNATNATNANATTNATSAAAGGQNTVIMPFGSSGATSGAWYEPRTHCITERYSSVGQPRQCSSYSNFWRISNPKISHEF
jgi:hypothetical protein